MLAEVQIFQVGLFVSQNINSLYESLTLIYMVENCRHVNSVLRKHGRVEALPLNLQAEHNLPPAWSRDQLEGVLTATSSSFHLH